MGSGEAVGTSEEEDEPPGARYGLKGAAVAAAAGPGAEAPAGRWIPRP